MAGSEHKINIRKVDFKKIFDEYFPSLCVFVHRFVNNEDVAKDLVQDVFVKIWDSGKIFETDNAMRVYIYRTAKNTALDYLKRERRKGFLTNISNCNIEDEDTVVNAIIKEETCRLLKDAIALLPPKARAVILLSLEGLSNQDVADQLDVSVNTVKTHKSYAFRKIRRAIGGQYILLLAMEIYSFWEYFRN